MSFAEKLKMLRNQNNLSQDKFGEIIGIHAKHISKYEQGKVLPNTETLIKIAKYFNVSTDYLLFSSEDIKTIPDLENKELLHKFELLNKMPSEDKKVVISLIDAFINKQK